MTTKKLKAELLRKRKPEPPPGPADFVSSGGTILNLGLTGHRHYGFAKGHFYWFVGDSDTGKTFVCLTCFAEAARNKNFDGYRLILDQPEHGALMDMPRFFGKRMCSRLEKRASQTLEEFLYTTDDDLDDGRPFIKILDSMDALSSEAEGKKFREQKTATRRGREPVGSMGDGKAKKNSSGIRQMLGRLKKTGSILIIISQTRDNIGFDARFNPKVASGGRALKFYATVQLWSSRVKKIKVPYKGKDRQVGIICRVETKKNRITGKDRTVEFPIYHSVGIDDTGGCIAYLVAEKHWKEKPAGEIHAPEFRYRGDADGLLKKIEAEGRESELRKICGDVWKNIEDAIAVERKRRYD